MHSFLIPPAKSVILFIPAFIFSLAIPVIGVAVFTYIITLRVAPLMQAAPDRRWDSPLQRLAQLVKIWLLQWRHPRYRLAGVLHIILFAGFLVLGIRSMEMVVIGIYPGFVFPGLEGWPGILYGIIRDYAATGVLIVAVIAMYRRGITRPARYAVPVKYGKDHTGEAVFVLSMIATLMISESLFSGSLVAAQLQQGQHTEFLAPLSLGWFFSRILTLASQTTLQNLHTGSYFLHDVLFFSFLCFLPMGKHFHVITSLFNVFFMRIRRGNIKPVLHGASEEQLDDLASFGAKKLEDFTWKHMLDFYSCADCGRCSDHCPANAAGRPLSPRFISIKGRDLMFKNYPIYPYGSPFKEGGELIGAAYDEDEIWSCTTCGACEQECPLGIEYIDKIVDLRRGMVDDGRVPQSLQKPLRALEKRGNPWGKLEKKRIEWTKSMGEGTTINILDGKGTADALLFVDSITSFDDRMQEIARSTATVLSRAGVDFGILGKAEKDSGHEVRRFGEEMLFMDLRDQNTDAIISSGAKTIVTADPHAYNALKNDYNGIPPVQHISEVMAQKVAQGALTFKSIENDDKVFAYHDPCYLGRHNQLYDTPRAVMDAIPGLVRVEMDRCKDRSFCCGGGGLMLFYEPEEEERMGVLRIKMAHAAGANVVITACPFCLVNIEDAIKVAGLEGQMEAMDLVELVVRQLV